MKLNKKGFTLIEVLAVIVILSVLMAIMIPTVNHIINKNDENSYEKLKEGIVNAAKVYISDNRYTITLSGPCTGEEGAEDPNVRQIGGVDLAQENTVMISTLIEKKYLKTKNGKIINPDTKQKLNLNDKIADNGSYINITYSCATREYNYELKDEYLHWLEDN